MLKIFEDTVNKYFYPVRIEQSLKWPSYTKYYIHSKKFPSNVQCHFQGHRTNTTIICIKPQLLSPLGQSRQT